MVNNNQVSRVFHALADDTRRSIVERLTHGPLTVEVLSPYYQISSPALSKHLRVLEETGLITRSKVSRNVLVKLRPTALKDVSAWMKRYTHFWEKRLDALETLIQK